MKDNYVLLRGNTGSDCKVIVTEKETTMSVLSLAISNNYYDQETKKWVDQEPTWVDVLCFRALADKVSVIRKGERVTVEARVSVITKKNDKGENIKQLSLIATDVERVTVLKNLSNATYNEDFINQADEQRV